MIVAEAKRTKPRFATHIDRRRGRLLLNNFEYAPIVEYFDWQDRPVEPDDEDVAAVSFQMRGGLYVAYVDALEPLTIN